MREASTRGTQSEPNGTKSEPKGNNIEPKGCQREPKVSQRDPKVSQREPKVKSEPISDQNALKNRSSENPLRRSRKLNLDKGVCMDFGVILGAIFHEKSMNKSVRKLMPKK